jgi:formylmethanofuran dehydrogenase subunit E
VTLDQRDCAQCGEPFTPHHPAQIYCRMNCSTDAQNQKAKDRRHLEVVPKPSR